MASARLAGYKLATYKSNEGPRAGLVIGEDVFDAARLTGNPAYATVIGILADCKSAEGALKNAAAAVPSKRDARPGPGPTGRCRGQHPALRPR